MSRAPPGQGHAQVARAVPPLLLRHQPPVVVPQGNFPRLPWCVPRAFWRPAASTAGDAVVGRRRVGDVRHGRTRHVARDAVVAPPPGLPLGRRQRAAPLFVARQATLAVVGGLRRRRGQPVRVVARNATELALALAETAARLHLLDVPDRLEPASFRFLHQEDRPEPVQRQAWAEVERLAARPGEAERALKVALLTDRFSQCGG